MLDIGLERDIFEVWQYSLGSNINKLGDVYVNERTESEWFAWKHRAEYAQQELDNIHSLHKAQLKWASTQMRRMSDTVHDLKQQIAELHASRESLLEYKAKLENHEYVLVPGDLSIDTLEAMWTQFNKRPDMQMVHNAMIKESQEKLE